MSVTVLVLAGVRPGGDRLAELTGVTHKALIPIGGTPMIERVIAALKASGRVSRIVVSIDRTELIAIGGVEVIRAKTTLSDSVQDALSRLGAPLFITTADHALLEPEWVRHFLDNLPDTEIVAGFARSDVVMAAQPDTKRTFMAFADGAFSGCNLFYLRSMATVGAVDRWKLVEAYRKRPFKLLRRLGPRAVMNYLLGRLTLARALDEIGRIAGVSAGVVEMPFGRAAIDVDKPSDLVLVRRLVEEEPGHRRQQRP